MRRLVFVTALLSLSAVTCGIAVKFANADDAGKSLQSSAGVSSAPMPPGDQPRPDHGPMRQGMDFPPPPPMDFHRGDPLMLARMLSDMETLIGVRSEQLDAWRAYTDAVQDFLAPPMPRRGGMDADHSNPRNGSDVAEDQTSIFPEHDAQMVMDRAEKARAVETAIETLRQVLTKDQIDKLSHVPFGHGPGFGPHPGSGPMPGPDCGGPDDMHDHASGPHREGPPPQE